MNVIVFSDRLGGVIARSSFCILIFSDKIASVRLVSSALSIIIYNDKLEITNSGKSPFKQSELKKNHLSMPYNPDIAHIVFLRGYIEKIGRGTLKIIEACKQAGIKAPVWEIGEQTVKLTFINDVKLGGAVEGATEEVKEVVEG